MNGPTHMVGAAAAGVGVAAATGAGVPETAALVAGALLADRVPDQDRHISSGPNHRSLTHSLLFAGGLAVVVGVFIGTVSTTTDPGLRAAVAAFGLGIPAGYLAHLLLDSLTPKRVWLLLPGGPRFGAGFIDTGGIGEGLVFVALCVLGGGTLLSVVGGT